MDYQKNPTLIENDSFNVIDNEIGEHNFNRQEYELVRRLIHSTGDFDFLENSKLSKGAIDAAVAEEARKKIATWSKYFPGTKDAFFYGFNDGESYDISCWINETTTVRVQ